MRARKTIASIMAATFIITTAFSGIDSNVYAESEESTNLIASYDFNGTIGENSKAVVTGLSEYEGEVVYGTGRSGEENDQAVQLGDYGIDLNQKNIGEEYSVSLWVKPDTAIAVNTPVLFLGYHDPEQWVGVAGDDSANYKVWTRDANDSAYSWTTVTTVSMPVGEWSMLTLTESGNTLSAYVNGTLIGSGMAAKALDGENQDIYLGVTDWDSEFTGLIDDVSVYSGALSASQVRTLYDGKTAEEVFQEEGFTVPENVAINVDATKELAVTMSAVIENATTTFSSSDESIVTVDETGTMTGVSEGNATITTTVTVGDTTTSKSTTVTVTKKNEVVNEELAVDYSMEATESGVLKDVSGNGNDATIHNTDGITFTTEDGKNVMNITSTDSYLDLPTSIMDALSDKEEFTIESTYARSENAGGTSWLFCFGSKPKTTGTNYMFYCPYFSFGSGQVRAGIKDDSNEQLFTTAIQNDNDKFYTVDMVFSKGTIKLYINGVKIGEDLDTGYSIVDDVITNGTADDILGYIGKSCWSQDTNFMGKISSFRIYNKAMTDEEVQTSDPSYQQAVQDNLDTNLVIEDLLGTKNTSSTEVSYDLLLPASLDEMPLTWESSNENVISTDGEVTNGSSDTTVTLTATATSGVLTATKTFTFTVKALDRTALDAAVKEAKALVASSYITDESVTRLNKALARAEAVTSQSTATTATAALKKAMNLVTYKSEYVDPFQYIEGNEPVASKTLTVKSTAKLFTLPTTIKNMVTVKYSSSNTSVAKYSNGTVTALKAGYSLVTVTVTAKSDGFAMEYKTLVTVKAAASTTVDLSKVIAKAAKTKLAKGATTKITVSYPAAVKAANPTITYKASGAVTVNSKGKVTAKKAGTGKVVVTVKAKGKSISKTITFKVGALTGKSTVKKGKSITLKVKGISGTVKWSVNKTSLAKINSKGKLTAKKKGTVVVTAKVSGVTLKKTIKIK